MGMAALAVRFFVELFGVAAIGFWGWQTGPDGIGRLALAVGAAGASIVAWAFVVAPKAQNGLAQPIRDVIGTALLLLAAGGLAAAGEPRLAVVFAAVVVIDWLAMVALGPGAVDRLSAATATRR